MPSTDIPTLTDEMRLANERLQALVARASREDRDFTPEEAAEKDVLVARMTALDQKRRRSETFAELLGSVRASATSPPPTSGYSGARSAGPTLGALIAAHPAIGQIRQHGAETPVTFGIEAAFTGTTCGPLLTPPPPPPPSPVPGLVVPRPLRVADLLTHTPAGDAPCSYLQLLARTGNAAVVAPGTPKPDVGLVGNLLQAVYEKVAGTTAVNDELLEDAEGLARVLDVELRRALADEIDSQLITSVGSATSFVGLRPGAIGPDTDATGLTPIAALAKAAGALFDASGLYPDSVVVNGATAAACASVLASTSGDFLTGPPTLVGTRDPELGGRAACRHLALAAQRRRAHRELRGRRGPGQQARHQREGGQLGRGLGRQRDQDSRGGPNRALHHASVELWGSDRPPRVAQHAVSRR
jgi:hypothetical protein